MTTTPQPDVTQAVADLYRTFGDGPLNRPLVGCEHCSDPQALERWAQTPVRQLTEGDLHDYLYSAMSTIGDEEDFKHFLPRLFELGASASGSLDLELLGTHLTRARWNQWPDHQRSVVRAALEALWQTLADTEYEEFAVDSIVCAVALARMEMPDRLSAWQRTSAPLAKANLNRFMEHNRDSLRQKRRLANAFWDESPAQEVRVADWLRSAMGVY